MHVKLKQLQNNLELKIICKIREKNINRRIEEENLKEVINCTKSSIDIPKHQ